MSHDHDAKNNGLDRRFEGLLAEIDRLKRERADLELIIETTTEHSDQIEDDLMAQVEAAIRHSERQFRLICDTIPVAVIVFHEADESIRYANPPAARLTGLRLDWLLRHHFSDFWDSPEWERLSQALQRNLALADMELTGRRADGEPFRCLAATQPLIFHGEPCVLAAIHDVTERYALEARLRKAQKLEAVGTLAGGIAHDFNNVLAAIQGHLFLAQSQFGEPDQQRSLDAMEKAVFRAGDMVRQLLVFCRQTEKAPRPVKISELVDEVVELMRPVLASAIAVEKSVQPPEIRAMVDTAQFHQLLVNLLVNARNAMEERRDGRVKIEIGSVEIGPDEDPDLSPGRWVELAVRDNGSGMPEAVRERIFEPLFTTRRDQEGTGLGLAVVQGIVQAHGGSIRVESEPGAGTAFFVRFPPETKDGETRALPPGKRRRVLVVDDEHFFLDIAREMLDYLGYEIQTEREPARALEQVRERSFHLAILDLKIPEMDGFQLAAEIRKAQPALPLILATGYRDDLNREAAAAAGFSEVIQKPITVDRLKKAVQRAIG